MELGNYNYSDPLFSRFRSVCLFGQVSMQNADAAVNNLSELFAHRGRPTWRNVRLTTPLQANAGALLKRRAFSHGRRRFYSYLSTSVMRRSRSRVWRQIPRTEGGIRTL